MTFKEKECQPYKESEIFLRRALSGFEKLQGKDHFETMTSVHNLAIVLERRTNYEETERLSPMNAERL